MPEDALPIPEQRFADASDRVLLFIRMRLGAALRRRFDPRDVLQETFLAALRAIDRFEDRGEDSFVRWLNRIAETTIRSLAEREGAAKRTPPGEAERITAIFDRVGAAATGPVTAAARSERNDRLERAMEELSAEERAAVLGRYFLGLTVDEIAAEAGTSPTSVRRRIGRAVARLGEELGS